MCGRFQISLDEILHEVFLQDLKDLLNKEPTPPFQGEFYPGSTVFAINKEEPLEMTWGIPLNKALIFNARSEEITTKPFFQRALNHRLLIPATSFNEWKDGRKFDIKPKEGLFYFAGLWQETPEGQRLVILTTEADMDMKKIHQRMPVIVSKEDQSLYLRADIPFEELPQVLKPWEKGLLIQPSHATQLSFFD